jgi:hypothetical protein
VTSGIRVTAGGRPTAEQMSALTAAVTALLDEEAAAAPGGLPPAYRSRWRRAGMADATEVPPHPTDDGPLWGGRA